MVEVHHFAFGPVSPLLALISAMSGCLLGIILTAKSQKVTGRRRVRLLSYASVAIGVTAVWQSHVLALMGLAVQDTILRLDLASLALSLGIAVGSVTGGLFLIGYGIVGFWRLVLAGAVIGLGVAASHAVTIGSVRVGGVVTYDVRLLLGSIVAATVTACALLWFVLAVRGLRSAIAASGVSAIALCAVHYVGEYAISVHIGASPGELPGLVDGIAPMAVVFPTLVLGGVLAAMLWFFSVGSGTTRDLQVVFSPREDSGQIEAWMIRAVTARVTSTPPAIDETTAAIPTLGGRNGLRGRAAVQPVFRSVPLTRTVEPPSPVPAAGPEPITSAMGWPTRVPGLNTHEPPRAKDQNNRGPGRPTTEDRVSARRRASTVHRDTPPTAGVAPVSPAPVSTPSIPTPSIPTAPIPTPHGSAAHGPAAPVPPNPGAAALGLTDPGAAALGLTDPGAAGLALPTRTRPAVTTLADLPETEPRRRNRRRDQP